MHEANKGALPLPSTPPAQAEENGRGTSPFARALDWLLGLLPAALALFLGTAFAASLAIPVVKIAGSGQTAGWGAGALYLLAVACLAWLLGKTGRWPEKTVVWGLIASGFIAKTAAVLLIPRLPFNIDQSLFHQFAARLAATGYGEAELCSLSGLYDYPLWAARIFPVHYLLERFGGPHAWAWTRGLNVIAATLILVLTHSLARSVLPPGKRKWAVFLLLVLPFQTFWTTDYSHHLYSSLYLLAFAWAARGLAFGTGKMPRRIALSVLASACMLCMSWQGGVDLIAAAMAATLVILHFATQRAPRRSALLALLLLVVPLSAVALLKGPLLMDRIHACDASRQNSVLPAFMARGWCPATGGEYNPRYEQLDRATPWPEKSGAMFRLVASQIRHQPLAACFWLPGVKTAKLFLVGYASNLEESLARMQSPALPAINWVRRAAAAFFLFFALLGCIRLAALHRIPLPWISILLVPLLTWGAYVLAGETSPRYSVFCQPFLAILGAFAFCRDPAPATPARTSLPRMATCTVLLLAAAGTVALAARVFPAHAFYADFRDSQDGETTRPAPSSLFERAVALPAGTVTVSVDWPVPGGAASLSFYPVQCIGSMEGAALSLSVPGTPPFAEFTLDGRSLPSFVSAQLPAGASSVRVDVSRAPSAAGAEGALVYGYLLWSVP